MILGHAIKPRVEFFYIVFFDLSYHLFKQVHHGILRVGFVREVFQAQPVHHRDIALVQFGKTDWSLLFFTKCKQFVVG